MRAEFPAHHQTMPRQLLLSDAMQTGCDRPRRGRRTSAEPRWKPSLLRKSADLPRTCVHSMRGLSIAPVIGCVCSECELFREAGRDAAHKSGTARYAASEGGAHAGSHLQCDVSGRGRFRRGDDAACWRRPTTRAKPPRPVSQQRNADALGRAMREIACARGCRRDKP